MQLNLHFSPAAKKRCKAGGDEENKYSELTKNMFDSFLSSINEG